MLYSCPLTSVYHSEDSVKTSSWAELQTATKLQMPCFDNGQYQRVFLQTSSLHLSPPHCLSQKNALSRDIQYLEFIFLWKTELCLWIIWFLLDPYQTKAGWSSRYHFPPPMMKVFSPQKFHPFTKILWDFIRKPLCRQTLNYLSYSLFINISCQKLISKWSAHKEWPH